MRFTKGQTSIAFAILAIVILFALIGLVFVIDIPTTVTGRGQDALMTLDPPYEYPDKQGCRMNEPLDECLERMPLTQKNLGRYRPSSRDIYGGEVPSSSSTIDYKYGAPRYAWMNR